RGTEAREVTSARSGYKETQYLLFNKTGPPEIYTLSLHDARSDLKHAEVPRSTRGSRESISPGDLEFLGGCPTGRASGMTAGKAGDRKSTRLNSSHVATSYAVFCLKKDGPGSVGDAGSARVDRTVM